MEVPPRTCPEGCDGFFPQADPRSRCTAWPRLAAPGRWLSCCCCRTGYRVAGMLGVVPEPPDHAGGRHDHRARASLELAACAGPGHLAFVSIRVHSWSAFSIGAFRPMEFHRYSPGLVTNPLRPVAVPVAHFPPNKNKGLQSCCFIDPGASGSSLAGSGSSTAFPGLRAGCGNCPSSL
jgi:hypothetical protein